MQRVIEATPASDDADLLRMLVACAEIAIVGRQIQFDAPVYDTSRILAEAIVREASRGMPAKV